MPQRMFAILAIIFGSASIASAQNVTEQKTTRYITLAEAITIALEQGKRGAQAVSTPVITGQLQTFTNGGRAAFVITDDVRMPEDGAAKEEDQIKVVAIDKEALARGMKLAQDRFDSRFITSMTWSKVDTATTCVLNNFNSMPSSGFEPAFYVPLATAGFTRIDDRPNGFNVIRAGCSSPKYNFGWSGLLPSYTPPLDLRELGGFWSDCALETVPELARYPGKIAIVRTTCRQSRAEFERQVNVLLFNVECAYWNHNANCHILETRELGLQWAEGVRKMLEPIQRPLYIGHMKQVQTEIALSRQKCIEARIAVDESERELRHLLNLPLQDRFRLVPRDMPTLVPHVPDWVSAVREMLVCRPELQQARDDVQMKRKKVIEVKSKPLPPADGQPPLQTRQGNWQIGGSRFDLSSPSGNEVPFGTGPVHPAVRAAQLELVRAMIVLKNQELKAARFLRAVHQNLIRHYQDSEDCSKQWATLAERSMDHYQHVLLGAGSVSAFIDLENQMIDAGVSWLTAVAKYNIALVGFEYAKGTIKQSKGLMLAADRVPGSPTEAATSLTPPAAPVSPP